MHCFDIIIAFGIIDLVRFEVLHAHVQLKIKLKKITFSVSKNQFYSNIVASVDLLYTSVSSTCSVDRTRVIA